MERGFVVADADLSPERRLAGTKGQGLATYRELVQNFATKTMPEGGALGLILERWMAGLRAELAAEGVSPERLNFSPAAKPKFSSACMLWAKCSTATSFRSCLFGISVQWKPARTKSAPVS